MLDPVGRAEVLVRMRQLAAGGVAVVLITQHMDETLGCDRLVALDRGRVVFDGAPAAFFRTRAFEAFPWGARGSWRWPRLSPRSGGLRPTIPDRGSLLGPTCP